MSDSVKEILKRTSILTIILGATLLLIGASGNISIENFNLTLPDLIARFIVGFFGSVLLVFGSYVAWRETFSATSNDAGEFSLVASGDTSKKSFRLENYLDNIKTIDLLGYNLKGMLKDLREPLAEAIIKGAVVRIVIVDITSPTVELFKAHSNRPNLMLPEWIAGLEHIKDIQDLLSKAQKVTGRLEIKVTSWVPSNNLILLNASDKNGILKAGIHSLTFRQPLSDRLNLVIRRNKYEKAFSFYVKGFDMLWDDDSSFWDGKIPELQ